MLSKVLTVSFLFTGTEALKIGNKGAQGSMSCQECVSNGHNYCLKGEPWMSVASFGGAAPTSICCPSSGCSNKEDNDSSYFCYEDKFASVDLAITACPRYMESCGTQEEILLKGRGDV